MDPLKRKSPEISVSNKSELHVYYHVSYGSMVIDQTWTNFNAN